MRKTPLQSVILFVGIVLVVSSCGTTSSTGYGTIGAVGTYQASEPGTHWVRPQEITYRFGEKVTESMEIQATTSFGGGGAAVYGLPQLDRADAGNVAKAIGNTVALHGADGFYLLRYTTESTSSLGTKVTISGYLLYVDILGEVSQDRADTLRLAKEGVVPNIITIPPVPPRDE